MRLGYELVKEQLFFRKEMMERVSWFIRLRWVAVGAGFFTSCAAFVLWDIRFPLTPVTCILGGVLVYNIIFYGVWRRLDRYKTQSVRPYTLFAHTQISMDLVSLFALIYLTGGTQSPLLIFVIFHVVLTGILLSIASCFIYTGIILLVTGSFIAVQYVYGLPHVLFIPPSPFSPVSSDLAGMTVLFLVYAVTLLGTAYLITSIKLTLRTKGRELLSLSKELDQRNTMLTSLYEMVRNMGLCTDLKDLMDIATRSASKIMGVKGCSIKLLDDAGKTLRFAST